MHFLVRVEHVGAERNFFQQVSSEVPKAVTQSIFSLAGDSRLLCLCLLFRPGLGELKSRRGKLDFGLLKLDFHREEFAEITIYKRRMNLHFVEPRPG